MTFIYSFGELVGCSICNASYKRPSVHQFVSDSWVNLDGFCDSYGMRRNQGGYEEAHEFAKQMIEAEEKAFIIKHTLCRTQRREQLDKAVKKIQCQGESANSQQQITIAFCCADLPLKELSMARTARVEDVLFVLSLVYNIPCNQLELYCDGQHKRRLENEGIIVTSDNTGKAQRLFVRVKA